MKKRDIEFEKAVGRRIRDLRKKLDWSQQHLADVANLEQNQIQRVENAKNAPTLTIITAIASALGKQPFELLKTDHQIKVNKMPTAPVKKKPTETTKYIKQVLQSSYLKSSRSVADIVRFCEERYGVVIPSSATSAVLAKMVDNKEIRRIPDTIKGRYRYQKRK